ncbi:MAG: type II secretion system F family protein [Pirellulales bacterium]
MSGYDSQILVTAPGLLLLGMAVHVALRMLYGPHAPPPRDELCLMLTAAARTMIVGALISACAALMGVFSIFFVAALGAVAGIAAERHQASQRQALLGLLAAAAGSSVPLGPAVAAFAGEWRDPFAGRVGRLATLLESGVPLDEALGRVRGLVGRKALALIQSGAESGALRQALAESVTLTAPSPPVARAMYALWYFVMLSMFGLLIMVFVMLQVIPAFAAVMSDFGQEVPRMTQWLIDAGDWSAQYLFWLPALLLVAAAVAGVLYLLGLAWHLPRSIDPRRRLDASLVLRGLALGVDAGRPLIVGLTAMARAHPRAAIRSRLAGTLSDMSAGADWAESLHARGLLPTSEVAVMKSATLVGNLGWALREAAATIERRFGYRLQALLDVLIPSVILIFGLLVAFVVVALFIPLFHIIESLVWSLI